MKKVVLLSGGIDSTTCLAQAVQVCGAENVTALCVFYGQKHSREMAAARKVAAYYGVRLLEQDIAGIMSYSNCSLLGLPAVKPSNIKATRSSWLSMAKVR